MLKVSIFQDKKADITFEVIHVCIFSKSEYKKGLLSMTVINKDDMKQIAGKLIDNHISFSTEFASCILLNPKDVDIRFDEVYKSKAV